MKTPRGTVKREGKVWAWSIGDKAGYCATKADALNDMAIAAAPSRLEQFAKLFGVTVEQCEALRAKNKAQLTEMYNQACSTGKRVNGYTSEQLRQLINGLQIPQ